MLRLFQNIISVVLPLLSYSGLIDQIEFVPTLNDDLEALKVLTIQEKCYFRH